MIENQDWRQIEYEKTENSVYCNSDRAGSAYRCHLRNEMVYKNKRRETAEEEASTIYISKVDVDTITAFSYEVDHVTYTFTKDGDTWTYDGDTSLDMDEEAIDSMLSTLSSLTAIEEISDYTDLKEFGFDQPEDLISYTTSEGSVSLFVGNKNDTLNAYYIISADGGSIYLTETSLADAFFQND